MESLVGKERTMEMKMGWGWNAGREMMKNCAGKVAV